MSRATCNARSQTSAWNALAFGLKEWVAIEPDVTCNPSRQTQGHPPSSATTPDDASYLSGVNLAGMRAAVGGEPLHRWFSRQVPRLWAHARCVASSGVCCSSSSCSNSSTGSIPRMMRFTQLPGDIVHIPCGWQHAVLNRCLSVAITHNFVAPESRGGIDHMRRCP